MIFKDYYKILELKTNKVSSDEIKNAYRLAVKKNHPDLNIQDSLAEEKIKDINEAYRLKKIEPKSSQTIKNALFDYFDFINNEDNRLISCGVAHISAFKHLNNEQK